MFDGTWEIYLYSVFPMVFLFLTISHVILRTNRLRSWKPLTVVLLLWSMAIHQSVETVSFIQTGDAVIVSKFEAVETATNLIAGFSAYFALGVINEEKKIKEGKDVLDRVMRHDLRNSLTVIKGQIDLVETKIENGDYSRVRDHLAKSEREIERMDRTASKARRLESILAESRRLHSVSLDRILEEEVERLRERFDEADIRLGLDGTDSLKVVADEDLRSVIRAVAENGVVHNDKDEPRLEIDVERNRLSVTVSVEDNGPGIPEEDRSLVFGHEEKDDLRHGEGISLFFADKLVEEYRGDIRVRDSYPEGTVFEIRLWRSFDDVV
ncbi:sensor histidine kinase [Halorutilales archaeon Cl-col2-1]